MPVVVWDRQHCDPGAFAGAAAQRLVGPAPRRDARAAAPARRRCGAADESRTLPGETTQNDPQTYTACAAPYDAGRPCHSFNWPQRRRLFETTAPPHALLTLRPTGVGSGRRRHGGDGLERSPKTNTQEERPELKINKYPILPSLCPFHRIYFYGA